MATHIRNRLQTPEAPPRSHDGRSLTDLIKELRDETTMLMRKELDLAKIEISEKLSRTTRNTAFLVVGGMIAFAGALILLMALAAGLYVGMVAAGMSHEAAGWLAPLIVGGGVTILGYGFIQKAISTLREESLVPQRTVDSLRHDKDWVKEKVR